MPYTAFDHEKLQTKVLQIVLKYCDRLFEENFVEVSIIYFGSRTKQGPKGVDCC